MSPAERAALLDPLVFACVEAGLVVLHHRANGFAVERKADESPVTAADRAAEAVLLDALARLAPGVPVVAEEEVAAGRIPEVDDVFFLVDALDGTAEFVKGGTDFTVNVGLIEGGRPTLGVVHAPARGRIYVGAEDVGAWTAEVAEGGREIGPRRPLKVADPGERWAVVGSRSHLDPRTRAYVDTLPAGEMRQAGSSLKFGLVALGEADVYPRCGPTSEWDTAAGDAMLRAAGGRVRAPDGSPFRYGKPGFKNGAFVASGDFDTPLLGPFL